jgi:hypothetical protein
MLIFEGSSYRLTRTECKIECTKGKEWKLHKETASAPFMKRGQASPFSLAESEMCFGVRENFEGERRRRERRASAANVHDNAWVHERQPYISGHHCARQVPFFYGKMYSVEPGQVGGWGFLLGLGSGRVLTSTVEQSKFLIVCFLVL